jgi:hypothetical protein
MHLRTLIIGLLYPFDSETRINTAKNASSLRPRVYVRRRQSADPIWAADVLVVDTPAEGADPPDRRWRKCVSELPDTAAVGAEAAHPAAKNAEEARASSAGDADACACRREGDAGAGGGGHADGDAPTSEQRHGRPGRVQCATCRRMPRARNGSAHDARIADGDDRGAAAGNARGPGAESSPAEPGRAHWRRHRFHSRVNFHPEAHIIGEHGVTVPVRFSARKKQLLGYPTIDPRNPALHLALFA